MPFTFYLDQQDHRARMERSRLAVEKSRKALAIPVWPLEYVPPLFPRFYMVPRFRPDEKVGEAFARIAGTLFDPLR